MSNVTVDLNSPSLYVEPDSRLYRFKRKLTFKHVMKWLRFAAAGRREFDMLEVGTGAGYFASFVEQEFPGARITGVEYDPRLVEYAKAKVQRATIQQGNAEELQLPDNSFDVVVSLQVIEHLYRPELMLTRVHQLLRPNGTFIFTTPNVGGTGARLMGTKWHGYCDDHVSLKTVAEWQALAERHGFTSVYCGSTFFSGIPWMNRLPLALFNWALLLSLGSMRWKHGESFVGVFRRSNAPAAPAASQP
ncbi:MAG: class I SAM-dependent methyltransferase [Rhizobacter sp.]|nr:class I SAM-dependent methyltransferase [Rhizobacter sp.]